MKRKFIPLPYVVLLILLVVIIIGYFSGFGISFEKSAVNDSKTIEKSTDEWKTYNNARFGYTINYPGSWLNGVEAQNGDGKPLHRNNDNEILVYGTHTASNFSTQGTEVDRANLILNDGRNASILKLKDGEGKINYIVFFSDGEKQYVFFATVTEDFFKQNEQLLKNVAKSFKRTKGLEDL